MNSYFRAVGWAAFAVVLTGYCIPASLAASSGATAKLASSSAGNTIASNWQTEDEYWRSAYPTRPYYNSNTSYSVYEPAYHFGFNTYLRSGGTPYQDLDQTQLFNDWVDHGNSALTWAQAQPAAEDAYDRVYQNNHLVVGSPTSQ